MARQDFIKLYTPPCIMEYLKIPCMHDMHDYTTLCGFAARQYAVRSVRIHPHCRILFNEFRVCPPYYD